MGLKGFVKCGVASVVAGCSTHPPDLIKVRMLLQGETTASTAFSHHLRPAFAFPSSSAATISTTFLYLPTPPPLRGPISLAFRIFHSEGLPGLFSDVSATVLRQALHSTTSMGVYDMLKQRWTDPEAKIMRLTKKVAAGLISGRIGAAVGNPADVEMVRMQADGRLPPVQRRNYESVLDAITRISKQEGFASLWRGSSITVNHAMIVTASQLAA